MKLLIEKIDNNFDNLNVDGIILALNDLSIQSIKYYYLDEIKSIRDGKCNIKDSYGIIKNDEIYLLNMYVAHYNEGSIFNHNETRTRKLLLHKKEIKKIKQMIMEKSLTLIPIKLYFKENKLKVELGVCRGKKEYDKRDALREKDIKREVEKNIKRY